jgi:hypothetical protein
MICFIHIDNTNTWQYKFFTYIIAKITKCGLYNKINKIIVNNFGNEIKMIKDDKICIEHYSKNILSQKESYRSLHLISTLNPDTKVLYINNCFNNNSDNSIDVKIKNKIDFLIHSLINNWENCIHKLNSYDCVGCNYKNNVYEENWWWATTNHISSLPQHYLENENKINTFLFKNNPVIFNIFNIYNFEHISEKIYTPYVENSLNNNIHYCKFGSKGIGLFNQIYSLVNCILRAKNDKHKNLVIVSEFLKNFNTENYCCASEILDINKINSFLEPYNVLVVPQKDVILDIISVKFGLTSVNIVVDITSKCKELFLKNNRFYIPSDKDINKLCPNNDPIPGVPKSLYVTFNVNGINFTKVFDECNELHFKGCLIDFNKFQNINWKCLNSIYDSKYNIGFFDYFLKNIYFSKNLLDIENENFRCCYNTKKLNVIHLRIEDDAIKFWSRINMMPDEKYKNAIETKYINLIKQHFDVSIPILILSMSENNKVIQYMKNNNYKFFMQDKKKVIGRDTNAILDYLSGIRCTDCFIGNINPNDHHGSTFSYAIINFLPSSVKKIGIDLDRINDQEYIIIK